VNPIASINSRHNPVNRQRDLGINLEDSGNSDNSVNQRRMDVQEEEVKGQGA